MNRNTNNNITRNDNHLEVLARTPKESDANAQVELQKLKRFHYQVY